MPQKHVLEAISTLVGFTIGAGVLGIPFVVAKAGFLTGLLNILLLGIFVLLINLYLGEVTLRTKGIHQLTGYAKIYLGKIGNYLMAISFIIFSYGALTAYIIKIGEFLNALLNPFFGGTSIFYSTIFFIMAFFIVYHGIKIIERSELWMVLLIIVIIVILSVLTIPNISTTNLSDFNVNNLFIPYGVVLFAFLATPAIPAMNEELKNNKKDLKKAIIIGSLIPLFVYVLFALIVVGVTGINTTDGAILGLANVLGGKMLILGSVFGILTMATSFIAVSFAVTQMYHFDYKLKKENASLLACFIPLIMALVINIANIKHAFFVVLDLTGSFGGSLAGILIILVWWKAKKLGNRKPEYTLPHLKVISLLLIFMFILGAIFKVQELLSFP